MRLLKQMGYAGIGLYSEYFIGLIISILVARALAPDHYGIYSAMVWNAALINILIISGLQVVTTKYVAEFSSDSNRLPSVLGLLRSLQYQLILLLVVPIACVIFMLHDAEEVSYLLLGLVVATAVIKSDFWFRISILKGLKRFDLIALNNVIVNPLNLILVLICVFWFNSLTGFLVAFCAASILYSLVLFAYSRKIPKKVRDREFEARHRKRIVKQLCAASFVSILASVMFKQSQVSVLNFAGFYEAAGFFNIGFVLATAAITLLPGVFNEVLLPRITQAEGQLNRHQMTQQAERYLLILGCLVAMPIILYADIIIVFLFGEDYRAASLALRVLMGVKLLGLLKEGANLSIVTEDRQQRLLLFSILLFILLSIMSYFFVPIYSLDGALGIYAFIAILQFIYYRYTAKKHGYTLLPWSVIMKISICAFVSISVAFFISDNEGIYHCIFGSSIFAVLYIFLLYQFGLFDVIFNTLFRNALSAVILKFKSIFK